MVRSVLCLAVAWLSLGSPLAAQPQNVTGRWVLSVQLDAGAGDAIFELTQHPDGTITGTYTGVLGNADVTGKIDGTKVEWSFSSQAGTVTYTGTVSGAEMEGTCVYGDLGEGTFAGRRAEPSATSSSRRPLAAPRRS